MIQPLKYKFLILLLVFVSFQSMAQVKFVNEFLNIGVGARSHGMFGSVIASTADGTSGYWNPAGLADMTAPFSVNAMHANWFGGLSNYDYMSITKRLNADKRAYGSLSVIRMGVDNIPNTFNLVGPDGNINYDRIELFSATDYAFLLSYGRGIGALNKLSLGGTIKVIHRSIGKFGKAWGFGADFGMKYRLNNKFTLGLNAKDITTTFNTWAFNFTEEEKTVLTGTGNDIPISSTETSLPRLVAGIAYHVQKKNISILTELDLNISTNGTKSGVLSSDKFSIDPSLGIEAGYAGKAFLRLGIGNIQRVLNPENADRREFDFQPNVGLGISLGRLRIDYALANVGNVAGALASHIFSLSLDFNEKAQAQ